MVKYEYNQTYISFKDGANHLDTLNTFGEQGWELVTALKVDDHNVCYLFKRKLQEYKKTLLTEGENNV